MQMFGNVYENCRVLITGHSGFKGSWLAEWLVSLGARVCGVSLRPVYEPNHFGLLKLPVLSEWANIRELGLDKNPVVVYELSVLNITIGLVCFPISFSLSYMCASLCYHIIDVWILLINKRIGLTFQWF